MMTAEEKLGQQTELLTSQEELKRMGLGRGAATQGIKASNTVATNEGGKPDGNASVPQGLYTFTQSQLDDKAKALDTANSSNGGVTANNNAPVVQGGNAKPDNAEQTATVKAAPQLTQNPNRGNYNYSSRDAVRHRSAPEFKEAPGYANGLLDYFKSQSAETPEQQKKRERRERTEAIIRSIGDGLSAVARIYFGTKGVNIPHDPKNDLTAQYSERKRKIDAEREKNKNAWMDGYIKMRQLEEAARRSDNDYNLKKYYYDNIADKNDRAADQKDKKINQDDENLDLKRFKIDTDADLEMVKYDRMTAYQRGLITQRQCANQIAQARMELAKKKAAKAGDSSLGGYWNRYYELSETPEGVEAINNILKGNSKLGNKVNNRNIRYIINQVDTDFAAANGQVRTSSGNNTTTKNTTAKNTSTKTRSNGKRGNTRNTSGQGSALLGAKNDK